MIRAAARHVVALSLGASLMLFQNSAVAMDKSANPGRSHALIVGVGEAHGDHSDIQKLQETLRGQYGFANISVILGEKATASVVAAELDRIAGNSRPEDSLVILLMLPIARPFSGIEALLVTADARGDSPSPGLPLFVLQKTLGNARYRQALVVTPDCSFVFKGQTLADSFLYGNSFSGSRRLSLLSFCPRDERSAATASPTDLIHNLAAILEAPPRDPLRLSASELMDGLVARSHDTIRLRHANVPPISGEGFVFARVSGAATPNNPLTLPPGDAVTEWNTAISRIAASRLTARDAATARQSATILKDIAFGGIPGRTVPSLSRQQAVIELSQYPTPVSTEMLGEIVAGAKDPLVRRTAINYLAKSSEGADLSAVRKALSDDDPGVQLAAISALSVRRDPASADLFAQLLKDEELSSEIKVAALRELARYGRPEDAGLFTHYFSDTNAEVKREALSGMRVGYTAESVASIQKILREDRDVAIREEAAYALGRAARFMDKDLVDEVRQQLVEVAKRGPEQVTSGAFWSLGELGKGASPGTDALCKAVASEKAPERTRTSAAEALGKLDSDVCLPALHQAAIKAPSTVRTAAILALGSIGNRESLPVLKSAQASSDDDVARAARQAIAQIVQGGDVDELFAALGDDSRAARDAAVARLATRKDAPTVDRLFVALEDTDYHVRSAAADALASNLEPRVTDRLIARFGVETSVFPRVSLVRALGGRDFGKVGPVLLVAASDRQSLVRQNTVALLKNHATEPAALSCLEVLKYDPSQIVRQRALESLSQISVVKMSRNQDAVPGCRPVPMLGWSAIDPKKYGAGSTRMVEVEVDGPVGVLGDEARKQPLALDGRKWIDFEGSGPLNVDAAISVFATVTLDSIENERILLAKAGRGGETGSWGLTVQNGFLRFGVVEQETGRIRFARSGNPVVAPGARVVLAASFDAQDEVIRLYVNGTEVETELEAGNSAEIRQIAQGDDLVRIGMPMDAASAPLAGTVYEVAYFGWRLPSALISALSLR